MELCEEKDSSERSEKDSTESRTSAAPVISMGPWIQAPGPSSLNSRVLPVSNIIVSRASVKEADPGLFDVFQLSPLSSEFQSSLEDLEGCSRIINNQLVCPSVDIPASPFVMVTPQPEESSERGQTPGGSSQGDVADVEFLTEEELRDSKSRQSISASTTMSSPAVFTPLAWSESDSEDEIPILLPKRCYVGPRLYRPSSPTPSIVDQMHKVFQSSSDSSEDEYGVPEIIETEPKRYIKSILKHHIIAPELIIAMGGPFPSGKKITLNLEPKIIKIFRKRRVTERTLRYNLRSNSSKRTTI